MQFVLVSEDYFTQAEFAEWALSPARGDDPNHYELINGRVVVTPPAGYPHGGVEVNAVYVLRRHVETHGGGRVFGPSQGFELPSGDTVQPDSSFISDERWAAGPAPDFGKFIRIVPDLVVEVLSRSTRSRDAGEKKAIYERSGVREYWLVDPRGCNVRRFVASDGRFDLGTVYEEDGGMLESVVLEGLRVPVAELLAR